MNVCARKGNLFIFVREIDLNSLHYCEKVLKKKKKGEKVVTQREKLPPPTSLLYTRTYLYCHFCGETDIFINISLYFNG